jgi:putative ABC transport system substrate-binding protein
LPAIYSAGEFVTQGALMAYSPDQMAQARRAAEYVARIFKGVHPSDLPVEQVSRFELAINLKAAKAIGLRIPQSVLARADRVIE